MDLSKEAQLRGFGKTEESKATKKEKDEAMKLLFACLELGYNCPYAIKEILENADYDHIKNKKSHPELRYKPSNGQLLDRKTHRAKTDSGKYTDYRHPFFAEWLKKFDAIVGGK